MLDEEREAIEWLKRLVKLNKRDNLDDTFAEILLNLIEKQSKEIEELKSRNQEKIEALEEWINGERVSIHCIHKDKIKAKIEEYDKLQKEMTFKNHNADNINDCYKYGDKAQKAMYQKEVLQSLLEKRSNKND